MRAGVPQVRRQPQRPITIATAKLQRLTGIVRHGKRLQLHASDIQHVTITRLTQQAVKIGRAHGCMCATAHPHRNA